MASIMNISNTNITPTPVPTFQTSAEMEALQILFGSLRVLRTNDDDKDETSYRELVYEHYDQCLEALSATTASITNAIQSTQGSLHDLDDAFRRYHLLLVCMEQHSDSIAPRDCIDGIKLVTRELEDSLTHSFEHGLRDAVCTLRGDNRLLNDAMDDMINALDFSSHDGILNRSECERVLRAMGDREGQMWRRLHRILMAVYDAQEVARRLCFVAAEFLRQSRVRGEVGIDDVCEWVEAIGDRVGDHSAYIDADVDEELVCDVD
jgi:hypothetical protein